MKFPTYLLISSALLFPPYLCAQDSGRSRVDQVSQSFSGLRVTPFNVEVGGLGGMEVRVVLKLENVTAERGSAQEVAVAAAGGGPSALTSQTARASLSSGTGDFYVVTETLGLPFGKNADDWLIIKPGGSVPVSFGFMKTDANIRGPFNFSAELVVFRFDKQKKESFQVYFPSLHLR